MHICSFHSVYVACTRYTVPVSDQPLPLLPVLKLASLTILPEQLLSSPQSSHSGQVDQEIPSRHQNHPPKASPICLDCVLTPVSGVLLLPFEINHDDELVWKLKKIIKSINLLNAAIKPSSGLLL